MPAFVHILEITSEKLRATIFIFALECAQIVQILCVIHGVRDTTWSVAYEETLKLY